MPQKVREMVSELEPDAKGKGGSPLPATEDGVPCAALQISCALSPRLSEKSSARMLSMCSAPPATHASFIRRVMPAISLPLHRISCVMTNPPPEAKKVARSIALWMHEHEADGITYVAEADFRTPQRSRDRYMQTSI